MCNNRTLLKCLSPSQTVDRVRLICCSQGRSDLSVVVRVSQTHLSVVVRVGQTRLSVVVRVGQTRLSVVVRVGQTRLWFRVGQTQQCFLRLNVYIAGVAKSTRPLT